MRKILTILIIFLVTIFWANYLVSNYIDNIEQKNDETKKEIIKKEEIEKKHIVEEKSKEEVENKISALRKRFELKWLIQKWDTYSENWQNLLALQSYLSAIKQNPWDKKVIKKIGDTYFEMNKFPAAYTYYKDLINTDFIDPKKIAITYFFTLPKEKDKLNFQEIYANIDKFNLDKDDTFFYKTSVECVFNKDTCQTKFENYIKNYTWENQNILYIKEAFNNYNSFQVKEEYFKDIQILLAIFKAKMYWVTNILSNEILKEKPDYLPVIKVLAKGNYEIWNYKEAKKQLLLFNKINTQKWNVDDPKVNYLIWIINIKLHEYLLSNIYFTKALKSGYKNRADISRRLIYNYYLKGYKDKMMAEFKNLINNLDNLNSTDYSLAIYYALINWENKLANRWTSKALQLYPKNDNFYWYKWWFYKESWDYDKAEYYLKEWLKLNISNPLINLNLGIIEADRWNFLKAKIYLKNTLKEDINWDFWKFASKKLKEILLEEKKIENEIQDF